MRPLENLSRRAPCSVCLDVCVWYGMSEMPPVGVQTVLELVERLRSDDRCRQTVPVVDDPGGERVPSNPGYCSWLGQPPWMPSQVAATGVSPVEKQLWIHVEAPVKNLEYRDHVASFAPVVE